MNTYKAMYLAPQLGLVANPQYAKTEGSAEQRLSKVSTPTPPELRPPLWEVLGTNDVLAPAFTGE